MLFKNLLILLLLFNFSGNVFYAQNQNISNGSYFDGEPYLVIDPLNSQHLVAAWMGFQVGQKVTIKSSFSNNGGLSWSTPIWQSHQVLDNSSADVSLAYDMNGNLYMSYIDHDNVSFTNGGVFVRKSTNGGLSWGSAVEAISIADCPNKLCVDRPWMVVDKSGGLNDGVIYITTMNANQPTLITPPYNPYLSVSLDNGLSFQTPRFIDTLNYLAGSTITQPMSSPSINANGEFYSIYPSYEPIAQGPFAHLFLAHSSSAGANIDHIDAYTITSAGVSDTYVKQGALLKCDPSDANHMAYFFLSEINGDADIYYIESLNGGLNWTSQQRINQDPIGNGKLQDLVWADFDTDGDLAVCWRDRRNGSGNTYQESTEIYGAVRWADSTNFSTDFPISNALVSHDVLLEGNGNDFMNVNFLNDTIYAVWGDIRTGVLSIYLNKFGVQSGTNSISVISQENMQSIGIYPNPSNESIFIHKNLIHDSFQILDFSGRVVLMGNEFPKQGLNISHLHKGKYTLQIINGNVNQVEQFIKN